MTEKHYSVLVSFCFLVMLHWTSGTDTPTVSTTLGKIVGERETLSDSTIVDTFLGIPYVKAPVGNLRFTNPVQHPGWGDSVRQTKAFGPHCTQTPGRVHFRAHLGQTITDTTVSEDCLFLNIYVPRGVDALQQAGDSLAVLIFFHGGSFNGGSGAAFNGDRVVSEGDVILVTVNYRVGFLGFFSTGTSDATGNYGLFDQHMAIKWVRDNAQAFGGDPSRITLIGHSAGGASVDFQMVSPLNAGLIQGGVSLSGNALAPWALEDGLKISVDFSKMAGCSMSGAADKVHCLRSKTAENLAFIEGYKGVKGTITWRPIIDGVFLPKHPRDLLRDGVTSGLRYMVGAASHDGSFSTLPYAGSPPTVERQRHVTGEFVSVVYEKASARADIAITRAALSEYGLIRDPMHPVNILTNAVDMNTDYLFEMPAEESARLNAEGGATTYRFTLSARLGYPATYLPKARFVRAEHMDPVVVYFGVLEDNPAVYNVTEEEVELARNMRRYVANFAKNGDPNVGDEVTVPWPQYEPATSQYLNLDTPITIETFDRERHYVFMTEVLPAIADVGREACPKPETFLEYYKRKLYSLFGW